MHTVAFRVFATSGELVMKLYQLIFTYIVRYSQESEKTAVFFCKALYKKMWNECISGKASIYT